MPETLDELIIKKKNAINDIPDKFLSVIDKQQEKAWQSILDEIKKLSVTDGQIDFSKANLAHIDSIISALKENLFGAEYYKALSAFVSQINVQAILTNQIIQHSVNFEADADYKALIQKSQKNVLLLFDNNAVTANIIQPITDLLTNSIASKGGFLESVDQLRQALTGDTSYLAKYSKTYAKDAFARSDRQYTQLVSKDMGLDWWYYDGAVIKGSRYFCCQRKHGYYHTNEVAAWGDDPDLWNKPTDASGECATKQGGGRDADTTSSTIFTLLGGYGCIDVLIPMDIKYVPEQWIKRATELGYYQE